MSFNQWIDLLNLQQTDLCGLEFWRERDASLSLHLTVALGPNLEEGPRSMPAKEPKRVPAKQWDAHYLALLNCFQVLIELHVHALVAIFATALQVSQYFSPREGGGCGLAAWSLVGTWQKQDLDQELPDL